MRRAFYLTLSCVTLVVAYYHVSLPESSNPIDGETTRLREHFARIDHELSRADVFHLTTQQRSNRQAHLSVLREYAQSGQFPHNHTITRASVPVFVDEHGTHCAVGYLIAQSGRPDLVQDISATANLATIGELSVHAALGPQLAEWIEESGLTVNEAARIQPRYPNRWRLSDGLCIVNNDNKMQCPTQMDPLPSAYLVASGFTALIALMNSSREPQATETGLAWRRGIGTAAGTVSLFLGLGGLAASDDMTRTFGALNVVIGIAFLADAATDPFLVVSRKIAGNGWAARPILDLTPGAGSLIGVSVQF